MLLATLPPPITNALILVWLFAMGGAIGSFLNVVVYRLPAKMSLIKPGSHCPACKRPIRWRDNVPILGWFLLQGHCRDCQAPISRRYPVVEAIVAVLFLLLGVAEGLSWGMNLPLRPVLVEDGIIFPPLSVEALIGVLAYHLVLLSTLLAGALIEYDGNRVPARLALPALIVGSLAPLVWPDLHPVPAWEGLNGLAGAMVDVIAGLAAGAACGLVAEYLILRSKDRGRMAIWACVGLMLGWQATVVLALLSTAVYLLLMVFIRFWPEGKGPGWLTGLTATVLVWLLLWGRLTDHWPGLK